MQEISYRSCRKYIIESEICRKCLTEVVNCRKQLTESEKKNLFKNEKIKNFTKNAHRKLIFLKKNVVQKVQDMTSTVIPTGKRKQKV